MEFLDIFRKVSSKSNSDEVFLTLIYISGKILLDLHAEGRDDAEHECLASVKVNDIERSPMGRGMNVVVLDNAGNYLISKNFDTADPEHAISEGVRMSRFLNELPHDRIVCVASGENVGTMMICHI